MGVELGVEMTALLLHARLCSQNLRPGSTGLRFRVSSVCSCSFLFSFLGFEPGRAMEVEGEQEEALTSAHMHMFAASMPFSFRSGCADKHPVRRSEFFFTQHEPIGQITRLYF